MSLANELVFLMRSDVSSGGVETLVSKFGYWLTNTLVHFFFGFAGFFCWVHFGQGGRRALNGMLIAYCALQLVQLTSQGSLVALTIDGVFDIAVLGFGYLVALWIAGREVIR